MTCEEAHIKTFREFLDEHYTDENGVCLNVLNTSHSGGKNSGAPYAKLQYDIMAMHYRKARTIKEGAKDCCKDISSCDCDFYTHYPIRNPHLIPQSSFSSVDNPELDDKQKTIWDLCEIDLDGVNAAVNHYSKRGLSSMMELINHGIYNSDKPEIVRVRMRPRRELIPDDLESVLKEISSESQKTWEQYSCVCRENYERESKNPDWNSNGDLILLREKIPEEVIYELMFSTNLKMNEGKGIYACHQETA